MSSIKRILGLLIVLSALLPFKSFAESDSTMLIRIAEIEIFPEYLQDYKEILKIEAEASVRLEDGVIAIVPMYQRSDSTQIRILEIYANDLAYQNHLKTPHFLKYKTTTMKMVKSLKLNDMFLIDSSSLPMIFRKVDKENIYKN